jgi:nucleotide-binding universal stress UspA family protein
MPGILVGVDGSEHSNRALRWALRQAAQQHVPLTVLSVRPSPVRPATGIYWGVHAYPEDDHNPDATRKAVQQFVDKAESETGETPPEITVDVVTGDAAEELINASRDADMVVVGSRGGGGFAQLLMGSVSSKVTHHAACPVVVVRATRQAP